MSTCLRQQALIRNGSNIHTGHAVPSRERCTLVCGMSRFLGISDKSAEPAVADVRSAWSLDPAVRDALPYEWQRVSWDRMAAVIDVLQSELSQTLSLALHVLWSLRVVYSLTAIVVQVTKLGASLEDRCAG